MTIICDLDDTLINTTQLNNDSYNYALEKFGFARIQTTERITRGSLAFVDTNILEKIVLEKQKYFNQNWLSYRTIINKPLLSKIKAAGKQNCYLWTKADKARVAKIMQIFNLSNYFADVIFDSKTNFCLSLQLIKRKTNANNFIIYENDYSSFYSYNHNLKIINQIINNHFIVNGYTLKL